MTQILLIARVVQMLVAFPSCLSTSLSTDRRPSSRSSAFASVLCLSCPESLGSDGLPMGWSVAVLFDVLRPEREVESR